MSLCLYHDFLANSYLTHIANFSVIRIIIYSTYLSIGTSFKRPLEEEIRRCQENKNHIKGHIIPGKVFPVLYDIPFEFSTYLKQFGHNVEL